MCDLSRTHTFASVIKPLSVTRLRGYVAGHGRSLLISQRYAKAQAHDDLQDLLADVSRPLDLYGAPDAEVNVLRVREQDVREIRTGASVLCEERHLFERHATERDR